MTRRDKNNKHRYPCLFPGSSTTGSSGPATYIQCHAVPFLSWIKSAWGRALFFHESLGPWSLVPLQLCWPSCSTVPSRTKTTWDTASWVNITHCNFAPAFLDPTWGAYVRFWQPSEEEKLHFLELWAGSHRLADTALEYGYNALAMDVTKLNMVSTSLGLWVTCWIKLLWGFNPNIEGRYW